jgi:hypothetical protein
MNYDPCFSSVFTMQDYFKIFSVNFGIVLSPAHTYWIYVIQHFCSELSWIVDLQ